jgi:hypothetical protein
MPPPLPNLTHDPDLDNQNFYFFPIKLYTSSTNVNYNKPVTNKPHQA